MRPTPAGAFQAALCAIFLTALSVEAHASSVKLAWDPDPAPDIAGYRLYSGTSSRVYTQIIQVGNTTTTLVSNLTAGKTYFFAVTAYNTSAQESTPSNEVSYTVPTATPTPSPTPTPTATPTPSPTATPTPSPTPTRTATPTPTPSPKPTPTPTPTPTTGPAQMLKPPPGSTFSSSKVTFSWSAGSATSYFLLVGNTLYGSDIYNSGGLNVLSATVNNIPTNGHTIYVTLGSQVNGSWVLNRYTYTAFKP